MEPVVLVADDDPAIRMVCRVNLELDGYRVLEASSAAEIDEALAAEDVAAILLDVHLGPDDGVDIARRLRERRPGLRVALLTGSATWAEEWNEVADGVLPKPFSLEELAATVAALARPG
jgi:two-component system phosphate regulon response regulator PhoB